MSYRIIGDSCTDLPSELKNDNHFKSVPLSIQIDDFTIIDDESFNQLDFLKRMSDSPNSPKSSCPAPEEYINNFYGEEDIYVVTLSAALSGSHNSATLAKKLYLEENPKKNIEVFDSCSASVGQALIVMKIKEYVEAGKRFDEVVTLVNRFRDEMKTLFVLESLETLRKNGRLSNIKALITTVLNIKPVMGATDEGTIIKLDQARGINKALISMAKTISANVKEPSDRILGIAHCNNYERALFVKEEILKLVKFKDVFISDTAGISSLYANDGGIIVSY